MQAVEIHVRLCTLKFQPLCFLFYLSHSAKFAVHVAKDFQLFYFYFYSHVLSNFFEMMQAVEIHVRLCTLKFQPLCFLLYLSHSAKFAVHVQRFLFVFYLEI